MRCYQITNSTNSKVGLYALHEGIAVDCTSRSPRVVVFDPAIPNVNAKLQLAAGLTTKLQDFLDCDSFCLTTTNVLHADVENRSEVWLVPETEQTRSDALVLFTSWHQVSWMGKSSRHIDLKVSLELGSVLWQVTGLKNGWQALATLARLQPYGRITLERPRMDLIGCLGRFQQVIAHARSDGTVKLDC